MSRIIPVPTTRVGDFFVRQRLTGQVQLDQLDLYRLQNQVSTGQRLQLPSDDSPAALRAINLQRLLDRKGQIHTNLQSSDGFLSAAGSSISSISNLLIRIRAEAVGVAGTLSTDQDRQAVVQHIDQALQTLVDTGNASFQGRYLFSGSRATVKPFVYDGQFVEYHGNEGSLRSYVDLERLFETNLAGTEVFGGISAEVLGSADLNPHVTPDTLLSTLNGGEGISRNAAVAVSVNTGVLTETSVVDLSSAVTIGDVARLIELNAPPGTSVTANVTGTGLVLSTTSGTIFVSEVAQGRTARELGILTPEGAPVSSTLVGSDVDPEVLKTTPLANLLGTKAQGRLVLNGSNNDLVITAAQNGVSLNGVTVEYVGGGTAGSEVVSYNAGTSTLTVQVQEGFSTANQVAAAITAEGTFTAHADYRDVSSTAQAGTGAVEAWMFGVVTSGGSGEVLDTTSGLILNNGGQSVTLDISTAQTVEDLLNLIRNTHLGLHAEINVAGNGINVRSRWSGADLTIGENGGTTATQLGLRTYTGDTQLADFNRGVGVETTASLETLDTSKLDSLRIFARNGVQIDVDLSTATSLEDVVDLINNDSENNVVSPNPLIGTTTITAQLSASGNGINLVDSSSVTNDALRVEAPSGSQAAEYLGFVHAGTTTHSSTLTDADGNFLVSGKNVLGHDMRITARDGTQLWIDLAGAETVQDVIDRINANPNAGPTSVTARLAIVGNGIELVDASTGTGTLTVQSIEGSAAAHHLGFVAAGQTSSDPADVQVSGANQVLTSEDRHTYETDSVFNALLRLRTALDQGDVPEIGRSIERLDEGMNRINFAASEIGIRQQNLGIVDIKLQDENVQLRSALSQDLDVDLVEAISNLTARQYAFEASLRSAASLLQISLLNFI
jgi:flagellin-like hook-associated protein FlgL